MDTTIREVDEQAYEALRALAALEGRSIGELVSEAIRSYLARTPRKQGRISLRTLTPEPFPEGNEHLSSKIDAIVYGPRS